MSGIDAVGIHGGFRCASCMNTAILLHLPADAERFEGVARRLPGVEFLLGKGRWAPARRDSREATRRWLRRRGWVASEHPQPRFDLILATGCCAPDAVARWLAPGGSIVLWHESRIRSRLLHRLAGPGTTPAANGLWLTDPLVARVCAAWPDEVDFLDRQRVRITGDPRWDALADPAAASRARHALGVSGERPVTLLVLDDLLERPHWSRAFAALRADSDIVVRLTTPGWLERAGAWPPALTGPGLYLSEPDEGTSLAELFALADLVVAPPGVHAHAAVMAGTRTLLVAEGNAALRGPGNERATIDGSLGDRPACVDSGRLRESVEEVRAMPAPPRTPLLDGRAAERLAAVFGELSERPGAPATATRT